ncbi:hypothetical protein NQ317_002949 [Molorchus minor]|uniref:Uncharacterized protein n=1 Tax=Molorchus minor TaxID=1323400 RepID=A0ABQ9IU32_9CUCU|nr:hypothetical protein NQ317_002949 [Molorchus minor]
MAETGQEEGKQNIRIEGALLLYKMAHSRWTILYNPSTIKNPKILCQRICFGPQMDVHYSYRSIGCPLDLFVLSGMRHSFYLAEIPPMPLRHLNRQCGAARCSNKSAVRDISI